MTKATSSYSSQSKRSGDDRRVSSDGYSGSERRSGGDRRDMPYGLRFKTAGSLTMMEDWLDEHAYEQHHLAIVGMSEDLETKEVVLSFSSDDLREQFKAYYRSKS